MAKKNKKVKKTQPQPKAEKDEDAITWDDIDAMSDSEEESGVDSAIELNTKAKNLKNSITKNIGDMLALLKKSEGDNEEEFEEDVLDGSSSEGEDDKDDDEVKEDGNSEEAESDGDDDEEKDESNDEKDDRDDKNGMSFIDKIKNRTAKGDDSGSDSDSGSESESDSDDGNKEDKKKAEKYSKLEKNNNMNSKALSFVAAELNSVHSKLPWAETFVIVPPTPIPFGENGDPESNPLDIHDDLKREVAFYNTALEAVNLARPKLKEANIPFIRPDDFFAEMVKTDGKLIQEQRRSVCLLLSVRIMVLSKNN